MSPRTLDRSGDVVNDLDLCLGFGLVVLVVAADEEEGKWWWWCRRRGEAAAAAAAAAAAGTTVEEARIDNGSPISRPTVFSW